MMIWFAGVLQKTCCNNANKNKANKKHWVVSVMSFNIFKQIDWHYVVRQYVLLQTQNH